MSKTRESERNKQMTHREINFRCECGGQIKPCLTRAPDKNINMHGIFQCDSCQKFSQPFIDSEDTPAKIFDITCTACHQRGLINSTEPAINDSKLEDFTLNTEDETHGEITIVTCVHCGCSQGYNTRTPCETLYP